MSDKPDKADKAAEKAEKAEARKIKALQRKAKKLAKEGEKTEEQVLAGLMAEAGIDDAGDGDVVADTKAVGKENRGENDGEGRTVSAVLTSHPLSRDVHIDQFTLLFHGHELLMDAKMELNHGRCEVSLRRPDWPSWLDQHGR
jgi:hypothetical protein